jgi:hypothetical protein
MDKAIKKAGLSALASKSNPKTKQQAKMQGC